MVTINPTLEAERKILAARQAKLEVIYKDPFMGFDSIDEALQECKFSSQAEVLARLFNRENLFISGLAGSGKTTVINRFVEHLDAEFNGNYSVAITASTGIAATLIGGRTIHSWAGLGISTDPFNPKSIDPSMLNAMGRIKGTDVLIIDEISMLPAHLFVKLDEVLRYFRNNDDPFGGIHLVMLGDFLQLPPVSRQGEEHIDTRFAIETDSWKEAGVGYCFLDKTHRATDPRLRRILAEIAMDRVSPRTKQLINSRIGVQPDPNKAYTTLYTTNANVDKFNLERFNANPNPEKKLRTKIHGITAEAQTLMKQNAIPEVLKLKRDDIVMMTKNVTVALGYIANGSIGKIVGFGDGIPIVSFNNGITTSVSPVIVAAKYQKVKRVDENGKKFTTEEQIAAVEQVPLKLAYAITVHKSQGQSLDGVIADLSKCFQPGLGYVALSRVRSVDDLVITGFKNNAYRVDEKSIKISRFVKQKALFARREFLEKKDVYESLLVDELARYAMWPDDEGNEGRRQEAAEAAAKKMV